MNISLSNSSQTCCVTWPVWSQEILVLIHTIFPSWLVIWQYLKPHTFLLKAPWEKVAVGANISFSDWIYTKLTLLAYINRQIYTWMIRSIYVCLYCSRFCVYLEYATGCKLSFKYIVIGTFIKILFGIHQLITWLPLCNGLFWSLLTIK